MVFSSLTFLLVFLPLTVLAYYLLVPHKEGKYAVGILFLASLVYYAYWKPENVWILLASIFANYMFGYWIFYAERHKKAVFAVCVSCNVAALAYFKYTNFAIDTLNSVLASQIELTAIVLPIGISFFTFQKIAYLSDIYTGKHNPTRRSFVSFGLFGSFFPQLVAGPIVHHQEMMPQFEDVNNRRVDWENIFTGLILLSIGLSKKVLIADNLAPIVHQTFDTTTTLGVLDACLGTLAFSLQIYFDFSGYSDMAMGCGLLFNIKLPQNFLSPYKACDIQEFWRCWHITLARWMRNYLYIPFGGNRHGHARTLLHIFLTFLIGGLWHGAAWTFILWGAMHGAALIVYRIWNMHLQLRMPKLLGWLCTFVFYNFTVMIARVPDFTGLSRFLEALSGRNGLGFQEQFRDRVLEAMQFKLGFTGTLLFVGLALGITLFGVHSFTIATSRRYVALSIIYSALFAISCMYLFLHTDVNEFLYFQF